jgi:hypothetical protein
MQLAVTLEKCFYPSLGDVLTIPDFFEFDGNPYVGSRVHWRKTNPTLPCNAQNGFTTWTAAMYNAPYHTAQLVNDGIDISTPSKWTSVAVSDVILRDILRLCFTSVYAFLPFFHKDYFLHDMINGRQQSCSSLLVNSILAAGCVSPSYSE